MAAHATIETDQLRLVGAIDQSLMRFTIQRLSAARIRGSIPSLG
jgi:hypothetical protein